MRYLNQDTGMWYSSLVLSQVVVYINMYIVPKYSEDGSIQAYAAFLRLGLIV